MSAKCKISYGAIGRALIINIKYFIGLDKIYNFQLDPFIFKLIT